MKPVPTVEELLKKPPKVETTIEEFRELRHELSKEAERRGYSSTSPFNPT